MDDCAYEYEDWSDWIGQRVCAKETMFGTLRYFGETSFGTGIWCGIELDDSLGKNDGTVFGVKYFTCKPKYGIFVPISKVTKLNEKKENICEENQNKTFEIAGSCSNINPIKNNNLDDELFACNNLADEAIKKTKINLSRSRMDSEESLGILRSDEFDNSWDSLSPDYSLSNKSLPSHQFDINCVQDFIFTQPYVVAEKENVLSTISFPRYASTPRQVIKNKFVGLVDGLKANLSLDMEVETDDKVFSDASIENNSRVYFDFDKFKENPNLSSTSKTQLNFDFPTHANKENFSASENKSFVVNQQNNLNVTQTFSKQNGNTVCENDPMNATFALDLSSCITNANKPKESTNTEIINVKLEEIVNCEKNLNCTFKKDKSLIKESNLNATYELIFPGSSCQNYLCEKMESLSHLTDINNCNESEPKNIDQNDAHKDIPFDNVFLVDEKFASVSSSEKSELTNSFNINILSSLESNIDKITAPEVAQVSLLEKKFATDSNLLKGKLNDPVKQDMNTSVKAMEINYFEKESFSYKNKFLKELDKIQKSTSSTKSIPLPFNDGRRSLNIPKNSDKKFQLNSTFCLRDETVYSRKHTSPKSLLEPSTNKTNIHEKINNEFKKPFAPHSFVRGSKLASKSQSFTSTKIRPNQLPKSFIKGTSISSKSSSNTSHEIKVNSFVEPNVTSVKSDHRNLPNIKSKLPLNSRHSSKLPNKESRCPSNDLLTVPVKNNLLNMTNSLPVKQENNFGNKHCLNRQSISDFKIVPANAKDIFKTSSRKNCKEKNLSNDLKSRTLIRDDKVNNNGAKQFKVPNDIQNSKSKLPKMFQTLSFSTEEHQIPRRNSLSSYAVEKLPVGIVKPRSSLLQPIKFVNNGKLEIQNKCISSSASHSTKKTELKTKGQYATTNKVDTTKRNRK